MPPATCLFAAAAAVLFYHYSLVQNAIEALLAEQL